MPGMPMLRSWVSGKTPRAINVVTTGILVLATNSASSACARADITPPPTYSTGRLASEISFAAARI